MLENIRHHYFGGRPGGRLEFKAPADKIVEEWIREKEMMYTQNGTMRYRTMPRTQRIAAINAILKKAGIKEGVVDQTNVALFIEAVTGGNIELAKIPMHISILTIG